MDASFIKKSGKHTFGLDKFWNGSASRVEKGLECSLISLVDPLSNASLALACEQTPPSGNNHQTRIDFYLEHLRRTAPQFPESIKYGVFDGFYAKLKFVGGVLELVFIWSANCARILISNIFTVASKSVADDPRSLTAKLILPISPALLKQLSKNTVSNFPPAWCGRWRSNEKSNSSSCLSENAA